MLNNTRIKPKNGHTPPPQSNGKHTEDQGPEQHAPPAGQSNGKHTEDQGPEQVRNLFSLGFTETVFIIPLFVALFWGSYFLFDLYNIVERRATDNVDKHLPRVSDFSEALIYVLLLAVSRVVFGDWLFAKVGDIVLPRNKWDSSTRDIKVNRFGQVLFKFFYFLFVTAWGYRYLVDKDWFPHLLGGKGDIRSCFRPGFPFVELDPGMKTYYLFQMGYHVQSLLFQFRMVHRSDFIEMVLHHVVTIFLIGFSYMANLTRIGSLVLIIHDASDIFSYSIKAAVDTPYKYLIIFSYFCLLLSWGFARLLVFPFYIIPIGLRAHDFVEVQIEGYTLFNSMMVMLFFLHCYWYILFLKMGITFLNKGKMEDIIDKVKKNQSNDAKASR